MGDLLELNCTSEPSHPPSQLRWEINKEEASTNQSLIYTSVFLIFRTTLYLYLGNPKICLFVFEYLQFSYKLHKCEFPIPPSHPKEVKTLSKFLPWGTVKFCTIEGLARRLHVSGHRFTRSQALGHQDRWAKCKIPNTKYQDRWAKCQMPNTKYQDRWTHN